MAEEKQKSPGEGKQQSRRDSDQSHGMQHDKPFLGIFRGKQKHFSLWYFVLMLVAMAGLNYYYSSRPGVQKIEFSEFKKKVAEGEIKRVEMGKNQYIGYPYTKEQLEKGKGGASAQNKQPYKTVPVEDDSFVAMMDSKDVEYYSTDTGDNPFGTLIFSWVLPIAIMVLIWSFIFRRMRNVGAGVMNFGNNRAQLVAENSVDERFDDVAGVEEAKEELKEVVDFLSDPGKYAKIGGKIPKGVLLVGPAGTGKTLCARAVAGEAEVPFFKMSGADFVEMFVGVGAARVRDLFRQAKEKAPCIIFIDELDAIGKARGAGGGVGGHDEREQTLQQLLVEMDGFDPRSGVIILAATNRPEILDPALLRPGRFDRQILVDKPDLAGREEILRRHVKDVSLDDSVDLRDIAARTPGFAGADLANLVNEAAILAVRRERDNVSQRDFEDAVEKLVAGLEKKNRIINPKEREIVAHHETGHALTAVITPGADPVKKVTIVPHGLGALGYTMQVPLEDRFLMSRKELFGKIDVMLGGRAAEEIVFNEISTGAANDLVNATDIARKMITDWGMSEKFKNVVFHTRKQPSMLGELPGMQQREHSEQTQQYIDESVAKILAERFEKVKNKLSRREKVLREVAGKLMEKETISGEEFKSMVGEDVQANEQDQNDEKESRERQRKGREKRQSKGA